MNPLKDAVAYAKLVKIEHTLFALPFALSALCLAKLESVSFGIGKIILCVAAFTAARAAAMGFNRLVDRKFDAANGRTKNRPSATGEISPTAVAVFTAVSAAAFVGFAFCLNRLCFGLSFPALAVLLGYSYTKRFTATAHYFIGLALALAPIGGWIAVAGGFDFKILAPAAALFFSISAFDVIYALQDMQFDRQNGLHSIPAALGKNGALGVVAVSFFAAAAMFFLTGGIFDLGAVYFACACAISALFAFGLCAVAFGGAKFIGTVFLYINIAVGWLSFFGIAYRTAQMYLFRQ